MHNLKITRSYKDTSGEWQSSSIYISGKDLLFLEAAARDTEPRLQEDRELYKQYSAGSTTSVLEQTEDSTSSANTDPSVSYQNDSSEVENGLTEHDEPFDDDDVEDFGEIADPLE